MKTPDIHPSAFVAPGAVVRGDVHLAENSSVFYNAVLRGDRAPIFIGAGALVTQNAVIPDGSMVIGSPARVKRPLTPEEMDGIRRSAADYRREAQDCRALESV